MSIVKISTFIGVLALLLCLSVTHADSLPTTAGEGFIADQVRLIGRFDIKEPGKAVFTWPGSAMEFRFSGSTVSIGMESSERIRFAVSVDGTTTDIWVVPGRQMYTLASNLEAGPHTVRLTRLAESFSGKTAFITPPITDGKLLSPPPEPDRKLLVLGDSITAGYGVEGSSQDCSYSQETSSPLLSYAGLTAEALAADSHMIAWSGIGVWRSYGEAAPENPTIIDRYNLTLGTDLNNQWDVSAYTPDAIVVAIGTNDFWEGSAPEYQQAMATLVEKIQQDYAGKPLYLLVSPMLNGDAREAQAAALQTLERDSVAVLDIGKIQPEDGFGCDYHPNITTQQRLAKRLTARLAEDLEW